MKPVKVEFLFDFGSPNAYLCHKVIPAIEARTGATFEYVPILLGGLFKLANNRSPAEAFAGIPNKQAYNSLETNRWGRSEGRRGDRQGDQTAHRQASTAGTDAADQSTST